MSGLSTPAAVAATLLIAGCAFRDNPSDPQSPHFTLSLSRIDSVRVDPASVCLGDSVELRVVAFRSGGDSTVEYVTQRFGLAGSYLVVVRDESDGGTGVAAPVTVADCDTGAGP